jgi:putative transposase
MPEHVHLMIWPTTRRYSIPNILKSIKQSVARRATGWLRTRCPDGLEFVATGQKHSPYRFWQDGGGYDRNVVSRRAVRNMIEYMHANPVRRQFVSSPEEWTWSSFADWESSKPGPIRLDKDSLIEQLG